MSFAFYDVYDQAIVSSSAPLRCLTPSLCSSASVTLPSFLPPSVAVDRIVAIDLGRRVKRPAVHSHISNITAYLPSSSPSVLLSPPLGTCAYG